MQNYWGGCSPPPPSPPGGYGSAYTLPECKILHTVSLEYSITKLSNQILPQAQMPSGQTSELGRPTERVYLNLYVKKLGE